MFIFEFVTKQAKRIKSSAVAEGLRDALYHLKILLS